MGEHLSLRRWLAVAIGAKRRLAPIVAVAWVFAVFFSYYIIHKPFLAANVIALLQTAYDIIAWLALLTVALSLGCWLTILLETRFLRENGFLSPLEHLLIGGGLGLGLVSLMVLALGAAGLLYWWVLLLLVVLSLLLLAPQVKALVGFCFKGPLLIIEDRFSAALALYLAFLFVLVFIWTLTPPFHWDSLVYHLRYPRLYIQSHSLVVPIDSPYIGFPALLEMLFAAGMLLGSDVTAKLFHFTYALLTFLTVYAIAVRWFSPRTGWLAMAILGSAFSVVYLAAAAYVDLGLMFYATLAFHSLLIWLRRGERCWLVIAAIACGLGMGLKYTAFPIPLAVTALIFAGGRGRRLRSGLADLLLCGVVAGLVASPWYLKNWWQTGNPIYPYLFGGAGGGAFHAAWMDRPGTGLATAPWRLLLAPWEMPVLGIEGRNGYGATIGPLFLAALPLLALTWRKLNEGERSFLRVALIFCLVPYAFWLYGVARSGLLIQTRLLFPIFGVLALISAVSLERLHYLDTPAFSPGWIGKAVTFMALGLEALSLGLFFIADRPYDTIVGLESRSAYQARHTGTAYAAALEEINSLPPSAKVLFLWEPRSYGCQPTCWPDAALDNLKYLVYLFHDAHGVAGYLHEEGFTHVLLYKKGMDLILEERFDPITDKDLEVLHALQKDYLSLVADYGGSYLLYEVMPPPA
jgi:4-amino-4-deoxy-L-arabinose transferase-like glycosyltransferase